MSDFFKVMKLRFERCLEPTFACEQAPIRAHSVQNATTLGFIAEQNHVCELRMRFGKDEPQCAFEKVGRNQASTFTGLCGHHDSDFFKPIDTKPLSLDDVEQLFLIAYRSVTRELHTVMEAAMRFQTGLHKQIAGGLVQQHARSPSELIATEHLIKSYAVWKHRFDFYDQPFVKRRFNEILHSTFIIENRKPVLAASTFFSFDDTFSPKRFSAIALNVVPMSPMQSAVVCSYPKVQSGDARRYLAPIFTSSGEQRLLALSRILIDRTENFFMTPSHVDQWSTEKRTAIENAFLNTVRRGESVKLSPILMLF